MSKVYMAGDYAGLYGGDWEFYYGYEQLKDEQWAFVAKYGGKEIKRYSVVELGKTQGDNPEEVLLLGIARLLDERKEGSDE